MNIRHRLLTAALWFAGTLFGLGQTAVYTEPTSGTTLVYQEPIADTTAVYQQPVDTSLVVYEEAIDGSTSFSNEGLELSNNLARHYLGRDAISAFDWDAQSFNSRAAGVLKRVQLNLFRDTANAVSGTFWVRLYAATGINGSPGTNHLATLAQHKAIASLSSNPESIVEFGGLSIPLVPNTRYFIVVGTHGGGTGLLWGFTNDPVGAIGFPSLFTFSGDAGRSWRTPFMNALPQRMRVVGN